MDEILATALIKYPEDYKVKCYKENKILEAPNTCGRWLIYFDETGEYNLELILNNQTILYNFTVKELADLEIDLTKTLSPDFEYTGEYTDFSSSSGWLIRLQSSGTLKFKNLRGNNSIDVELNNGNAEKSEVIRIYPSINEEYEIEIGAAALLGKGGITAAFGATGIEDENTPSNGYINLIKGVEIE